MDEITKDKRFAHVPRDLRYREASRKRKKVYLDERFSSVLNKNFNELTHTVGPRGRPVDLSTKEKYDRFYSSKVPLDDASQEKISNSTKDQKGKKKKKRKLEDTEDSKDILRDVLQFETDYARGETILSDSSLDDSTTSEEEDDIQFEWAELDNDAEWDVDGNEVNETNRFAVCNMDWDKIKAVDLFMLFRSFCPSDGLVKSVKIYTSDYGKKKLEEEERSGPQDAVQKMFVEQNPSSEDESNEEDEKSYTHSEIVRKYQRSRLKYYYACVECDSILTASKIYTECDRQPLEGAGVCLDLRYIPNDMHFEDESHDMCSSVPSNYECTIEGLHTMFETNPSLNWDETDAVRKRELTSAMSKALNKEEIDEATLSKYIASGTSSDEESGNLRDSFFQENDGSLSPVEIENQLVEDDKPSSPVKKINGVKGHKKKKDRNGISENQSGESDGDNNDALHLLADDSEGSRHSDVSNLEEDKQTKGKKRKRLMKKKMREKRRAKRLDDFKVNISDKRFQSLLTSGEYNIDPAHPSFKETESMKRVLEEIGEKRLC